MNFYNQSSLVRFFTNLQNFLENHPQVRPSICSIISGLVIILCGLIFLFFPILQNAVFQWISILVAFGGIFLSSCGILSTAQKLPQSPFYKKKAKKQLKKKPQKKGRAESMDKVEEIKIKQAWDFLQSSSGQNIKRQASQNNNFKTNKFTTSNMASRNTILTFEEPKLEHSLHNMSSLPVAFSSTFIKPYRRCNNSNITKSNLGPSRNKNLLYFFSTSAKSKFCPPIYGEDRIQNCRSKNNFLFFSKKNIKPDNSFKYPFSSTVGTNKRISAVERQKSKPKKKFESFQDPLIQRAVVYLEYRCVSEFH